MLFRVFGPTDVDGPDVRVRISAEKPRRLLTALLLSANTWVAVDTLIDEIWPDGPPASAAGNVKTYVSQLRQLLPATDGEAPRIERRSAAYRLNVARTELDAMIFEDLVDEVRSEPAVDGMAVTISRLTGALALWRGRAYESLDTEQASAAAARLTELRWSVHDRLSAALIAAGRTGEAIAILRGLTTEYPLREPTWKHLMEALYAAGRRADALSAYQQARRTLVDELGVEPGAELQQLHQRLLREEPLPEPPPPARPLPSARRKLRVSVPALLAALAVVAVTTDIALSSSQPKPPAGSASTATMPPNGEPTGDLTVGVPPKRPIPGLPAPGDAKVLFGVGSQANAALASELVREMRASMLTSWFHEPKDLERLRRWRSGLVPRAYQDGYALHLVLADWKEESELPVDTRYGTGCGRTYPLSEEFLEHARELATIFAGRPDDPPLFVTVFHGVNIYGCEDGAFNPDPATNAYYRALKDRYQMIREIFHLAAPNARVALGWQGWQADHDEPETGRGRSMFGHFADVLRTSDFQSVVVWQPDDNVGPVRQMVEALGQYGPVLVEYGSGHTKPAVYDRDVRALLTDDSLAELSRAGLFAWNFTDNGLLVSSPSTYDFVKDAVRRHCRPSR